MGSVIEGTGFYLAERESDDNFLLCCYNNKPVPLLMPDLAEGRMESIGSEEVFLFTQLPSTFNSKERVRRPVQLWHNSRCI